MPATGVGLPRLLLVRHGLTDFNTARRFMGFTDADLNAAGRRQAGGLRDALAAETFDAVYSSDLKRALQTAEIVTTGRDLEIVACPELRETNYGNCEGLTLSEIADQYPDVAALCTVFSPELQFPDGESFDGFQARACDFLGRLEKHQPSETVLIVSHSGPLKVLLCRLLGIDTSHWLQFGVATGSLTIVNVSPRGTLLARLNDTSHLGEAE